MIVIIHPHTRKIDRAEEKFLLLLSALFGLLIALLCKVQSVPSTIYPLTDCQIMHFWIR